MITALLLFLLLRTLLGFIETLPKCHTVASTLLCIICELTVMGGIMYTIAFVNGTTS